MDEVTLLYKNRNLVKFLAAKRDGGTLIVEVHGA